MTRILVTSDFHGHLPPDLPETDLLIIAGDVTGFDPERRHPAQWILEVFEPWLERQKAEWIVGIAGNSDVVAQVSPYVFRDLSWTYLQDEAAEVGGFRIYGSPWSTLDGDLRLIKRWAAIPDDTEILVVHGPAFRINDRVASGHSVGSIALRNRLDELPDLRLLVTGHIHEAYGTTELPLSVGRPLVAVNGSYVGDLFTPGNAPIEVVLIPREKEVAK